MAKSVDFFRRSQVQGTWLDWPCHNITAPTEGLAESLIDRAGNEVGW